MTEEAQLWQRLFPEEPIHTVAFQRTVRLEAKAGAVVLDLGCGDNSALEFLRGKKRRVVWGADFQRHPHLVSPESFRLLGPGGAIPFADETFDVIMALWVLEHVERPEVFLREVRRVLRPGGVLLAHSISGSHYVTWIKRVLQLVPHGWTQAMVERLYGRAGHDTFPTCYRLNTRNQVLVEARRAGLRMVEMQRYAGAGYFSFHPRAFHAAMRADWVLERLLGCGRMYFSVRLEKPASRRSPAKRRDVA